MHNVLPWYPAGTLQNHNILIWHWAVYIAVVVVVVVHVGLEPMPGCNAVIRLFVHPAPPPHPFLDVPTVTTRCLHVLSDARDPSSEVGLNGRERVAENFA
jgi:hypothetical protein